MDRKEIATVSLANGLTLHFYDASKKVAGDRWNVRLAAEIPVDVDQAFTAKDLATEYNLQEIRETLGQRICFQQMRQQHFVDSRLKEEVLAKLQTSFRQTLLAYLSHPSFAKNFILREYGLATRHKRPVPNLS